MWSEYRVLYITVSTVIEWGNEWFVRSNPYFDNTISD